jgi:hypothetical protein
LDFPPSSFQVYKVMIASVIGAINGNTTIDASLTASLDAVCTECTSKLIAAWQGLGNNKDGDMDVGLQSLALACSKNPSTGAYCVPEIAQFSSTLVNAGSATAAVAAARSTVCNNPSPCIGKAASVLRSVSVKNVKTQILLQVLASADLCSVNGNQTAQAKNQTRDAQLPPVRFRGPKGQQDPTHSRPLREKSTKREEVCQLPCQ